MQNAVVTIYIHSTMSCHVLSVSWRVNCLCSVDIVWLVVVPNGWEVMIHYWMHLVNLCLSYSTTVVGYKIRREKKRSRNLNTTKTKLKNWWCLLNLRNSSFLKREFCKSLYLDMPCVHIEDFFFFFLEVCVWSPTPLAKQGLFIAVELVKFLISS